MTVAHRRRCPLYCGLMLLISGVLVGCNRDEVEAPRAQVPATSRPSAPVPSSSAAAHPAVVVTRPLRLAGKVSFGEDYYSKLASPVQGRVVEVRAALGQAVKDGQVLLVIDSPDITAAYANFLKETSELQFATRAHTLAQDLYETKALALKDLKQAENDLIKEQAEYHQAKERLLALKVPRSELEKPLGQQKDLGRFELKSPLTGTVVDRTVTPGTWVGTDPAQVLLTVADLDRLQMVAEVYEQDLPLIHVGAPAVVTVEAYPGEVFPAVVASIGDLVDRDTRTVKIRAWLNNDAHKLKPEMYARLNLGKS